LHGALLLGAGMLLVVVELAVVLVVLVEVLLVELVLVEVLLVELSSPAGPTWQSLVSP
jgi:hypothetical protein